MGIPRHNQLVELALRLCGEERLKACSPRPNLALRGMDFRRSGALSIRARSMSEAWPSSVRPSAFCADGA